MVIIFELYPPKTEQKGDVPWSKAVEKDQKIMRDHQEKVNGGSNSEHTGLGGPEAEDNLPLHYHVISEELDKKPTAKLQPILAKDVLNTEGGWFFSDIREGNCNSEFRNYYIYDKDAETGAIIADNKKRKREAKLTWSEMAFQEYKPKVQPNVFQNSKYIYRTTIVNRNTERIIADAMEGDGHGRMWYVFKPGSESFEALLGSENGRGAGFMANVHFSELEGKGVSEMHVCDPD